MEWVKDKRREWELTMPRPLPDHLIPNIKEVTDADTSHQDVPARRDVDRDRLRETPRDTVAPSGPHIVVTSQRSSEHGKVIGRVSVPEIMDRDWVEECGPLNELRKILCAALETLDAAVEDHHRAKTWDVQRTVTYGDPITMQFIANTDYIGGSGRAI